MSQQTGTSNVAGQPPIAVVGVASLFPNAAGLKQYWRLLRRGEDAIREVPETHWRARDYLAGEPGGADMVYCARGGFLEPTTFDPLAFGIPPTILEATDTAQLLSLVIGQRALDDAGYGGEREFDRTRASVILGVTSALEALIPLGARLDHPNWRRALRDHGVDPEVADSIVRQIAGEHPAWQENSFPGLLGNVVAGRIANRLNLKGTNCVVDAACASSLSAVHLATLELAAGRSDVVLTGGVDTFNDIFMFMCFSKTQALSRSGDARPFAADADGTVLGEGIGMVVLKRLADAERDGDRIHAVLKGIGTSSDGRSQSIYAPLAAGQAIALRDAYSVSGVSPTTIELVEAHGTGTAVGDAVEADALREVYTAAGARPASVALGSVKAQIGHTKAAAGAASLVKAILALRHKVIPPTTKVARPNPGLDLEQGPFYLPTAARPWFGADAHPRRAAVSSFGFGGSNFHAVLEEYGSETEEPAWDGSVELIALSSDTREGLSAVLRDWRDGYAAGFRPNELGQRAAASRAAFARDHRYRLVLVADFDGSLDTLIAEAEAGLERHGWEETWQTRNVFFGAADPAGALAFLFPGQGSQYVNMGRELVCHFPEARRAVEEARRGDGFDLAEIIFPAPSFDPERTAAHEQRLTDTRHAQPALGAVSLAMLRVLERFGIKPDVTGGHSFGELTALRAAGAMGDAALRTLATLRGRLMGMLGGKDGAMLAVKAPLAELDRTIRAADDQAVVANRNAPDQGIVSGLRHALEGIASTCSANGWPARFLNVSAAFHSRFMAEAQARFRDALDDVRFELTTRVPVFANVTAGKYPESLHAMRDLLAQQITHPVQFVEQIRNMYAAGARTFIEVGPKGVLSGLTRSILEGKKATIAALDASAGRHAVLDLARAIACIAAVGHAVELQAWERPEPMPPNPRMAVDLVGANYRAPRATPAPATAQRTAPHSAAQAGAGRSAVQSGAAALAPSALRPPTARPTAPANDGSAASAALSTTNEHHRIHRDPDGRKAMEHTRHSKPNPPQAGNGHSAHAPVNGHAPAAPTALSHACQIVQDGLAAMQALQQQTAQAHERFLHTQEQAQKSFQLVIEQQRQLMEAALGLPASYQATPHEAPVLRPAAPPPRAMVEFAAPAPIAAPAPAPAMAPAAPSAPPITAPATTSATNGDVHAAPRRAPEPAAAVAPAPVPASAPAAEGDLGAALTEVVAELTGYPAEMIELGMDLEADLGIDSIKRLEILGEMQRRSPALKQVDSQYLGSLRTLGDIVAALNGAGESAPVASPAATNGNGASAPDATPERGVLTAAACEEGPSQRPFDFGPGRAVLITRDDAGLAEALAAVLRDRGAACEIVTPDRAQAEVPGNLAALFLIGRTDDDDAGWLQRGFELTRAAGRRWSGDGGPHLLVAVSRLDGAFGLREAADAPLGGALAGLVKTAAQEWPALRAHAIDVDAAWQDPAAIAERVVASIESGMPLEVGLSAVESVTLAVRTAPSPPAAASPPLARGDVVVVSGGARGVTADCVTALARASSATFILLGRSPVEQREPDWLATAGDRQAVQQVMLARAKAGGEKLTPAELSARVGAVLTAREVRATLDAITAAGGRAAYHAVDVRDAAAVAAVLDGVRAQQGPIRGVIHGAGVLADRLIVEQSDAEFERVLATKVSGARNLIGATRDDGLRLLALFSSVAGRYGNRGQGAYAVANEALNRLARQESRRRPECRVVALNWGPWDGGMVTPALRREFERRGVALIGRAAGAQAFVAECLAPPEAGVEVVLGSGFGGPPDGDETLRDGVEAVTPRTLDAARDRLLVDHEIKGRRVLPLAVALDWLAGADAQAQGPRDVLEDVRVLHGIALAADERVRVTITADDDEAGVRRLTLQREDRPDRAAISACVAAPVDFDEADIDGAVLGGALELDAETIYGEVLFHGPAWRVLRSARVARDGVVAEAHTFPLAHRAGAAEASPAAFQPQLIDAALQLGLLWSHARHGCLALPMRIERAVRHPAAKRGVPEDAEVTLVVRSTDEGRLVADVQVACAERGRLYTLRGVHWTIDRSLHRDAGAAVADAVGMAGAAG